MKVEGLLIPGRLLTLLTAGKWPRTNAEANKQNLKPLILKDRVQALAPGENSIYLYPPPFATVKQWAEGDEVEFWPEYGALDEISPELTIAIGDFGLGSDTAIALDYRENSLSPSVIRLCWVGDGSKNHWVTCASSFDQFADWLAFE